MSAIPLTKPLHMTGEELAKHLGKDYPTLYKTYNRHRERKPELPPLFKTEIVADETKVFLEKLYTGQSINEHRQTPIRKIETPQYESIDKAKIEEDIKAKYEAKLQREKSRIEQEQAQVRENLKFSLTLEKEKAIEAERSKLKEQYADRIAFANEKVQLNVETTRARVELELRDELDTALKGREADIKRELDAAHQARIDDLQRQFDQNTEAERQRLTAEHEAEVEAQQLKPFFEKKMFAVAVLLITMSVQMYEVSLFIKATFDFKDLWLSSVWAGAFQFGGLMMTIHIGNHKAFYKSFLFWFATLSVVIDLFVLLPDSKGGWNTPARILFAAMFPLIEFAYGKIYLRLK